ncbi:MAG: type II secretion system GspH family protein [Muribaculaceae bacterium]|nr:type II secretion system GspH family protein [Muribaculaceae bacterium]
MTTLLQDYLIPRPWCDTSRTGEGTNRVSLRAEWLRVEFQLEHVRKLEIRERVKKVAFTLAETLITLGIIGVVAAMTIPNLMASYQKKQTVARLKKAYSVVQQAVRLSEDENGEVESWNTTLNGSNFFKTYIANYVKYLNEYTSAQLATRAPRTVLSGARYTGTTYNSVNSSHFTLLDGSMVTMNLHSSAEKGLWVGIDVNGLSKPNQIGKDTFLFFFSSGYGLRPLGDVGTPAGFNYGISYSRAKVGPKGTSGNACAKGKSGYWCAALIMQDGWKISGDYPWKGK